MENSLEEERSININFQHSFSHSHITGSVLTEIRQYTLDLLFSRNIHQHSVSLSWRKLTFFQFFNFPRKQVRLLDSQPLGKNSSKNLVSTRFSGREWVPSISKSLRWKKFYFKIPQLVSTATTTHRVQSWEKKKLNNSIFWIHFNSFSCSNNIS